MNEVYDGVGSLIVSAPVTVGGTSGRCLKARILLLQPDLSKYLK